MDEITIKIDWIYFLGIIGGLILLAWRGSARFTTIETSMTWLKDGLDKMESKVEDLWKDRLAPNNSPRQLNNLGNKILTSSGIKDIIDSKRKELLELVKKQNPTNPYDAEIIIINVMADLPKRSPKLVEKLKNGAFESGSDINGVLFVGSIYLRNLIFKDLGFKLSDLDKPKQ